MKYSSLKIVDNQTFIGPGSTYFVANNVGFQGVLSVEATVLQPNFKLVVKGPAGLDLPVSSSFVLTGACAIAPLYFPAGLYGVINTASTSIGVTVAIHPAN